MTLTPEQIYDHVAQLLSPLTRQLNLVIVELVIKENRGDVQIQVFADKPEGGIDIEACTQLNHALVAALDGAAVLPAESYAVEVSSPGLDRPLKTSKDFLRNLDYNIRLFLNDRFEGKKEVAGRLKAVTEQDLIIVNAKKKELTVPLAIIDQGLLVL